MASPTARTLQRLRREGYTAGVVERFIAPANVRRDFLGCIDLLAVHPWENGVLAVQCTTKGHLRDRLTKARARPELRTWLAAFNRFEVWGWHRRAGRWHVERVAVRPEHLEGAPLAGVRFPVSGRSGAPCPPPAG